MVLLREVILYAKIFKYYLKSLEICIMRKFHLVMCVVSKIATKLNKLQICIEFIKSRNKMMNKYYVMNIE